MSDFIQSFINGSTALCWALASCSFRNIFYAGGRTPWMNDQPIARPLPTHRTTQTQNKRTHRYPCLEWDSNPPIPAFEVAKTVHALDHAATVTGNKILYVYNSHIK
jgi:hypothetical protein